MTWLSTRGLMAASFVVTLYACGDDDGPDAGDSGVGADSSTARLDTVPSGEVADPPAEPVPGTCNFRGGSGSNAAEACTGETSAYFFVSRVLYPEVVRVPGERPRAAGFDLDGADTWRGDDTGCGEIDFESLDGVFIGVDNQGAALVPTLNSVLETDLAETASLAIAEGRFGLLIELRHWNGTADDDCLDVVAHDATPAAELELDPMGIPMPGQSIVIDGNSREFRSERMSGGELRANLGGFPVPQPFMVDMQSAHLRLRWSGDRMSGVVAGDVPGDLVSATLFCREPGFPDDILDAIVDDIADLSPRRGWHLSRNLVGARHRSRQRERPLAAGNIVPFGTVSSYVQVAVEEHPEKRPRMTLFVDGDDLEQIRAGHSLRFIAPIGDLGLRCELALPQFPADHDGHCIRVEPDALEGVEHGRIVSMDAGLPFDTILRTAPALYVPTRLERLLSRLTTLWSGIFGLQQT